MIHFWILKYILYRTFTKKNLLSAYYEGGGFGLLIVFPIMSFLMLIRRYEILHIIILIPIIGALFLYTGWDDKKVFSKYRYIESNKENLKNKFIHVYLFIILDILFYLGTLIYITITR